MNWHEEKNPVGLFSPENIKRWPDLTLHIGYMYTFRPHVD